MFLSAMPQKLLLQNLIQVLDVVFCSFRTKPKMHLNSIHNVFRSYYNTEVRSSSTTTYRTPYYTPRLYEQPSITSRYGNGHHASRYNNGYSDSRYERSYSPSRSRHDVSPTRRRDVSPTSRRDVSPMRHRAIPSQRNGSPSRYVRSASPTRYGVKPNDEADSLANRFGTQGGKFILLIYWSTQSVSYPI